jgi:adenine specific DNA methylase Mod
MEWLSNLKGSMIDYENFNPIKIFAFTRFRRPNTELFVTHWWHLIQHLNHNEKPTQLMMDLLKQRERQSKGKKSRLSKPTTSNEEVKLNSRIGLSIFQYRFFNARIIVNDIIRGKNN